jgi:hypothetical protein
MKAIQTSKLSDASESETAIYFKYTIIQEGSHMFPLIIVVVVY